MQKKNTPTKPPPRRKPSEQPWNDPHAELELYVSPELKERLGLNLKTTAQYLEKPRDGETP